MQAAATVLTAVYQMNLGPLVLLPLVLEKNLRGVGDRRHRCLGAECPFCHPTDYVKMC